MRFLLGLALAAGCASCGATGSAPGSVARPTAVTGAPVTATTAAAAMKPPPARGVPRPSIRRWFIPITPRRKAETVAYARHTVGLNWTAIGIEHVGFRAGDVLGNAAQLRASLRLTTWLRCRYRIPVRNVIGHAESHSSPYHHERVAALRTQTHSDWQPWAMRRYRALLRRTAC